jgi:hypothetical protein
LIEKKRRISGKVPISKFEILEFLGTVSLRQVAAYLMGREISACSQVNNSR